MPNTCFIKAGKRSRTSYSLPCQLERMGGEEIHYKHGAVAPRAGNEGASHAAGMGAVPCRWWRPRQRRCLPDPAAALPDRSQLAAVPASCLHAHLLPAEAGSQMQTQGARGQGDPGGARAVPRHGSPGSVKEPSSFSARTLIVCTASSRGNSPSPAAHGPCKGLLATTTAPATTHLPTACFIRGSLASETQDTTGKEKAPEESRQQAAHHPGRHRAEHSAARPPCPAGSQQAQTQLPPQPRSPARPRGTHLYARLGLTASFWQKENGGISVAGRDVW